MSSIDDALSDLVTQMTDTALPVVVETPAKTDNKESLKNIRTRVNKVAVQAQQAAAKVTKAQPTIRVRAARVAPVVDTETNLDSGPGIVDRDYEGQINVQLASVTNPNFDLQSTDVPVATTVAPPIATNTQLVEDNTPEEDGETNPPTVAEAPAKTSSSQKVVRGPGRPRKHHIDIKPPTIYGIVDRPANPDDIVEMTYHNPSIFKKILALFRSYNVIQIELQFTPSGLKIRARDHLQKSNIYINVAGANMILYYCPTPITICVHRESLAHVINSVGKTHSNIAFILQKDYRSILYCAMKNSAYNSTDTYRIEIINHTDDLVLNDDDSGYPIRFTYGATAFKSMIANAKKISDIFTVQKKGNDPLQLRIDGHEKVNYMGVYPDASSIQLYSAIPPEMIFSVSIKTTYVKQFADNPIGDNVIISADRHKKMSFTTYADKRDGVYSFIIKVFTDIG
jgi:hypothetical protein